MRDNVTAAAEPAKEKAQSVTHRAKRAPLIIGGVIALIVLLAGAAFVGGFAVLVLLLADAAFVGGRFLNQTAPIGGLVPDGASTRDGKTQTRIEIEPAEELPNSAPDAIGPFVERKVGMLKDVTVNAEPSHAHRAEQATPAYE